MKRLERAGGKLVYLRTYGVLTKQPQMHHSRWAYQVLCPAAAEVGACFAAADDGGGWKIWQQRLETELEQRLRPVLELVQEKERGSRAAADQDWASPLQLQQWMCVVAQFARLQQNPGVASDSVLLGDGDDGACGEVEGAAAGGDDEQPLLRSHHCKQPSFWESLLQLCCKEPFTNTKISTESKSDYIRCSLATPPLH